MLTFTIRVNKYFFENNKYINELKLKVTKA